MKKFSKSLTAVVLILYILFGAFLGWTIIKYMQSKSVEEPEIAEEEVVKQEPEVEEEEDEEDSEEIDQSDLPLLIGDSRTVQMNMYNDISPYFEVRALGGMGYLWMIQQIDDLERPTVIMMGANDLANIQYYIDLYKQMPNLTVVTVGPVQEEFKVYLPFYQTNAEIIKFNDALRREGFKIIDMYTFLMTNGFATTDGLHYTPETNVLMWQYLFLSYYGG